VVFHYYYWQLSYDAWEALMSIPFLRILVPLSVLAAVSSPVKAVDVEAFIAKNCTSCHQDEVYINKKKELKDLGDLEHQLHRCFGASKLDVDLETEYALVDYLNEKFYRFPDYQSIGEKELAITPSK
jgi:hypothetical protein